MGQHEREERAHLQEMEEKERERATSHRRWRPQRACRLSGRRPQSGPTRRASQKRTKTRRASSSGASRSCDEIGGIYFAFIHSCARPRVVLSRADLGVADLLSLLQAVLSCAASEVRAA